MIGADHTTREGARCVAVGCGVELGAPDDGAELCRTCTRELDRQRREQRERSVPDGSR